jgi:hypothetical protein
MNESTLMDGSFYGRYDAKIKEWESLIAKDPQNRARYHNEMQEYILDCIPYMQQYSADGPIEKHTIDTIFTSSSKKGLQRKEIFHEYLRDVEDYKGTIECEKIRKPMNLYICNNCQTSNILLSPGDSDTICGTCGVATFLLGDELSYKEEQELEKVITYSYKRDNHLNELILQFQAQETTNIPSTVIDQLRSEFRKQKIKNINDITNAKVRLLLKKLRLNKYYEHVPYITNILNGIQPPRMSQNLEDKLRMMFKDVQEPFDANCPQDRKNFLSYSYVLYKFCELLGEDAFLKYFPLLKSKEKLYQQDVMWKKICKDLRWEFIPTV